ncbi:envelope protein UL43 [macacine betaherpesvirus 9]|uniref:Protein U26 n=1 Tax=macacine betaherpesvirus 9 TaxID=2560568 RepID=A0A191S3V0_9BETA|nr:envelope protein UL43 [macacine betaherpesvirus 9]ANC96570.1 envelope protein UL43 [macacine betaherpesvirus 9]
MWIIIYSFIMGLALGNILPGIYCLDLLPNKTMLEQIAVICFFMASLLLTFRRINVFNYNPLNDFKIIILSLIILHSVDRFFLCISLFLLFSEMRLRTIVCRCCIIFSTNSMALYMGILLSLGLKIADFKKYQIFITACLMLPYTISYNFFVDSLMFKECLQRYKPIYKLNGWYRMSIKDLIIPLLQFAVLTIMMWIGRFCLPIKSCHHLFFFAVLHNTFFYINIYMIIIFGLLCLIGGVLIENWIFLFLYEFVLGLGYSALFINTVKRFGDRDVFTGDLLNLFFCSVCFVVFFYN